MMIVWNDRTIRWFREASQYTGYHRNLAQLLLERIPHRTSLCDLGCGAGLIDIELAPLFQQITCVDISPEAVQAVSRHAQQLGLSQISTRCIDASQLTGHWDTVMALFHGGDHTLPYYLSLANEQLILVTHGSKKGNFGPDNHKMNKVFDVTSLKKYLDTVGAVYTLQESVLEYGQPFATMEDAQDFVRAYSTEMTQSELEDYLKQKLTKTGEEQFPFYLPNQKKVAIIVIPKDKNDSLFSKANLTY